MSYSMLLFINALPWIYKTMYTADFCQLEMINSSNLFQIYKRIIKKTFRELSMFYLKINRNVLHIHEYSY